MDQLVRTAGATVVLMDPDFPIDKNNNGPSARFIFPLSSRNSAVEEPIYYGRIAT